jgi:hypothetical protein
MNNVRHETWAPLRKALEEITDAIAAMPPETWLEHEMLSPPVQLWEQFRTVFQKRHPGVYEAIEQAYADRNRALNEARRERTKQEAARKRAATLARNKAAKAARAGIPF